MTSSPIANPVTQGGTYIDYVADSRVELCTHVLFRSNPLPLQEAMLLLYDPEETEHTKKRLDNECACEAAGMGMKSHENPQR